MTVNEPEHRVWVSDMGNTDRMHPDVAYQRTQLINENGIEHQGPERWALLLTRQLGCLAESLLDLKVHVERGGTTQGPSNDVRQDFARIAALALAALSDLDGHAEWRSADYWPAVPLHDDPARWWEPRHTHDTPPRDIGPFMRHSETLEVKP